MAERAPSERVQSHPEDFEQPQFFPGTRCAYGHELDSAHGYMFFRDHWYCLLHFARNGPLQK